ncbi:MAG: beta strand repeat-containing protein, partial [Acidobacteriota bacterium]
MPAALAAAALCLTPLALHASTFTVSTIADSGAGSLRQAIIDANTAGGTNTIVFSLAGTITLTSELPVIQDDGLTIDGTTAPGYAGTPVITIDGGSSYRCMFVGAWTSGTSTQVAENVTIAALNFQRCAAVGGAGGGNFNATGGGGAGLGGAIFVADLANVTLSNVTFANNSATGGAGGAVTGNTGASGGGGMGGNGGGFSGVGGAGGGGGLGIGANGGSASGSSGAAGIATGAAGGAPAFCGGPSGTGGSNGGGGGGIQQSFCGAGGGGVGGGAGTDYSGAGAGGFGGGGGAGYEATGGAGGFGGGGGGVLGGGYTAGAGGFGGGAGGGAAAGTGGAAGFGGGSGVSASGANLAPGGGGLGAGGAVFIQQGGTLDFSGPLTESGSSVTGGTSGGSGAGNGSAFGSGMFIQGNNTVTFSPASGTTETITDAIADQTGSGGTGGNAGAGGVTMNGAGTMVLSGVNTYTGATTVASGTLVVNGSLSASTTVYVGNGATLGGSGTINGNVVLLGNGATIDNSSGLHILGTTTTWLFDASAGTSQTSYVSTAFAAPLQVTVTANGAGISGLTVNFTAPGSGASATLSAASCVTGVTGSCSVTATANTTPGSYAVTASVNGYSGLGTVSFMLDNSTPTLVVTSTTDDAGTASNCTFQASQVAGTDASCSLRDALLESASVGAASIFFDTTKFASATTILLTNPLPDINEPVTITGPGANLLSISGRTIYRVMTVGNSSSPTVDISGLTIVNGDDAVELQGGKLTITSCAFTGNRSLASGGAIYASGSDTLTVTRSTFTGNSASVEGGAIFIGGSLSIIDSTFSGNSAKFGGAILFSSGGGKIVNSTFSGNSVPLSGGALAAIAGTNLAASNNIFSKNTAKIQGAGIYNGSATVYADSNVYYSNLDNGATEDDCDSCTSNTNAVSASADPVAVLGSYGGPTQTMIPLPGSAAICAGQASAAAEAQLTQDQRGVAVALNQMHPGSYTGVGGYCPAGSMDAGAVQTDYALSFSTEPGPISPATSIAAGTDFQAAVTLKENGSAFTAASESIPLTLTTSSGTLSNGTASTASGVASYSTLQVSAPGSNDQLTANLTLNASPAVSISAPSSSFTVNRATPTLTFTPSPASQTYGTAIASASLNAAAAYNSSNVPGTFAYTTTVHGSPVTLTAGATVLPAGTYTITAAFTPSSSDSATYTTASTTAQYTVTAVGISASVTASNKTYTGTTAATITGCTLSGVLPADSSNVTCAAGGGTFASKNVGSGITVTATGIALSGSAAANYTLTSTTATTTASITPVSVTASVTASNKTYTGTTAATITGCTLSGVLATDSSSVSCAAGGGSFASKNVGSGIPVTATGIALSGSAAANYTLTSATATTTASITPVSVTASVTASNKTYTGTTAATITGCTLSGVLPADSSSVSCAAGGG